MANCIIGHKQIIAPGTVNVCMCSRPVCSWVLIVNLCSKWLFGYNFNARLTRKVAIRSSRTSRQFPYSHTHTNRSYNGLLAGIHTKWTARENALSLNVVNYLIAAGHAQRLPDAPYSWVDSHTVCKILYRWRNPCKFSNTLWGTKKHRRFCRKFYNTKTDAVSWIKLPQIIIKFLHFT